MNFRKFITVIFLPVLFVYHTAFTQPLEIYEAAELQIALQKLNTLGSVLYFAAHPDDENTAALAYFSKGKKYRTAYLSITRGDGGQNLIGPEKGAEIGLIRTQELLSARRIDGAEQYFSRAIDFGYSKTAEETFEFWGKDTILADAVWIIRKFRPDIIITRFPPDSSGGHGHHTASAMLAQEAFNLAADPNAFPEQLKYVQPWRATRMLWNSWRPGEQEQAKMLSIDVGEYNPLLGKSYTEIAAESRSMHKTQGFGSAGRRGTRYEYFQYVEGQPATNDVFDGIDTTWNRIPGGQKIGNMVSDIIRDFDPGKPSESIPGLFAVYDAMNTLKENKWVDVKRQELLRIIQSCAGLWIEAITDDFSSSPGETAAITITAVNRSEIPFVIEKIHCTELNFESTENISIRNNEPSVIDKKIQIPPNTPISQPYWLEKPYSQGAFSIEDQIKIGLADNTPSIFINVTLRSENTTITYAVPLIYRWTDRAQGELYRPFETRPAVTLDFKDKVLIFGDNTPKKITVRVKSNASNITGQVRIKDSGAWNIQPSSLPISLTDKYEEQTATFTVTPPQNQNESVLTAEAVINGNTYNKSLVEIFYPHIETQVYFPECQTKVAKLSITKPKAAIGYIMGAGDEIPDCLRNLGYNITLLDDESLESTDLSRYDTIITGIRAYNTRERLIHYQPSLLEYVKNGGTLIVQYNVSSGLVTENIGPYPFTIGRDRVTVEEAPVTFLNPAHQLLQYPNKITQEDFNGWVQERGLYFPSQWDNNYELILSCHDPGESDKNSGMLFTRYGKGVFIYTGYSWFRQLPAGVPGAYRLFVNMISAGKYNDSQ